MYWRLLTKDIGLAKKIFLKFPKMDQKKFLKKDNKYKNVGINILGTFLNNQLLIDIKKFPLFLVYENFE